MNCFTTFTKCIVLLGLCIPCFGVEPETLSRNVVTKALAGPLKDIEDILFVSRMPYANGHWYANFGYYGDDETNYLFPGKGEGDIGKIYKLNIHTGKRAVIFDAMGGSVRDPQVYYDGQKILFSYRKAESTHYHLYEIGIDGQGLRQLTSGDFDDIEASYLPDGGIVFVSNRSKRWVGCLETQVGTIYRCDGDGRNITQLSASIEHDNTPWVMPDGRILYTRWEYVDRNWMYHHLWTMNPDGTNQTIYYGNMHAKIVMIDAKPIAGTNKVIASFCHNHGKTGHIGRISMLSAERGPDDLSAVTVFKGRLTNDPFLETHDGIEAHDPYAISEDCFLLADKHRILVMDGQGNCGQLYASPKNANAPQSITPEWIAASPFRREYFRRANIEWLARSYSFPYYDDLHEPRPIMPRRREPILPDRTDSESKSGWMVLTDVYNGRNMTGVHRGQIKKLLIVEPLPKPICFTGDPDLVSFGGTHMLERVLGTVPVERDGSASFEVPANRPVFFVALDENDLSVKRMQSFTSVMPGETLGCVGCHEDRMATPRYRLSGSNVLALKRPPDKITPFTGFPDVLDFTRDIQPILDKHCVSCHSFDDRQGNVVLEGDLGMKWNHSYFTLITRLQVADGRHGMGNQPPRTIGSSASPLLAKLTEGHYDIKASDEEWRTVWLWLESGAPYAGNYAAQRNEVTRNRFEQAWTAASAAGGGLLERCTGCHAKDTPLEMPYDKWRNSNQRRPLYKPGMELLGRDFGPNERIIVPNDPMARFSNHVLYNFTRPEKSPILLAPLAKAAGGWGRCPDVYMQQSDPDYQAMLARIRDGKALFDAEPRWATPGFAPNRQYIRELKKFGVLVADFDPSRDSIDVFEMDQLYWRSLWHRPQ